MSQLPDLRGGATVVRDSFWFWMAVHDIVVGGRCRVEEARGDTVSVHTFVIGLVLSKVDGILV